VRQERLPAAVLAAAAACAVLAAFALPWWSGLLVFGALDRLEGPFGLSLDWLDRLPEVAASLGVVGLGAAALIASGSPWTRVVAAVAACVLAVGTAFLLAWSLDPPDPGAAGNVSLGAGAYVATGALAVAAIAAAAQARATP
jgi:hypothetical protein